MSRCHLRMFCLTVLTNYNGEFSIHANPGDQIRFTSIVTERKDIKLTSELIGKKTLIELKIAYHDIQEVVISRFKPTGNLKYDVNAIKKVDKGLEIKKVIGLPEPKGNGLPPELPVASLRDGGLTFSIESIFDAISGEKEQRTSGNRNLIHREHLHPYGFRCLDGRNNRSQCAYFHETCGQRHQRLPRQPVLF